PPRGLRHTRPGEGEHLRVHRGVLQPHPPALVTGVRHPGRVRANAQPDPPLNAVHFSWGTPKAKGQLFGQFLNVTTNDPNRGDLSKSYPRGHWLSWRFRHSSYLIRHPARRKACSKTTR